MSVLNAQQFLAQQAAIAAKLGNVSLSDILNSNLAGARSTGQAADPYVSYLQGVQSYATNEDKLYQDALNNLITQGTAFANSDKPSAQILAQPGYSGNQVAQTNYQSSLISEGNEYQTYLNNEQQDLTNYQNAFGDFQKQNKQQNNLSNQTLFAQSAADRAVQQAQAAAQETQRQQALLANKTVLFNKQQAYAKPLLQAAAVGSQQASQKTPSASLTAKLFPQSNNSGAGGGKPNIPDYSPQSNQLDVKPPVPGGQSNLVSNQSPIGANSNQIFK
jgi:hypothetical protein